MPGKFCSIFAIDGPFIEKITEISDGACKWRYLCIASEIYTDRNLKNSGKIHM